MAVVPAVADADALDLSPADAHPEPEPEEEDGLSVSLLSLPSLLFLSEGIGFPAFLGGLLSVSGVSVSTSLPNSKALATVVALDVLDTTALPSGPVVSTLCY